MGFENVTKICPNCNKMNKDSSTFCENCGSELPEKTSKGSSKGWWGQQSTGVKALIGIATVCVVGLVVIIVMGAMIFPDLTTSYTSPTTTTAGLQTYTGNGISFQHPSKWHEYAPDPDLVSADEILNMETTGDDRSILTVSAESADGKDVAYWKNISLGSVSSTDTVISQKQIDIAGVNGYRIDTSYTDSGSGYQSDIFFVKNGKLYTLLFTTDSLTSINSDINTIVNSFEVT